MALKASDRVTLQGKPCDRLTYERHGSLNRLVRSKRYGAEKSDITVIQAIGGAVASAGTHVAPGGSLDLTPFNVTNRCKGDRRLGGAGWHRTRIPGVWEEHYHTVTCGAGYAPLTARRQVTSLYAGRNGLANNGADNGPRLKVWPLFVAPWTDRGARGVYYAKRGLTTRDEATSKAESLGTLPKGGKFTVIAVVNAGGILWAMNTDGKFVTKADLTTAKPATGATPKPAEPAAKSVDVKLTTQNVIARRLSPSKPAAIGDWKKGATYADRVPRMAKMIDGTGATLVTTQEAGTAAMVGDFRDALGKGWGHLRYGDTFEGGDITQAVLADGSVWEWHEREEIQFTPAGPGSSHDSAPLAFFEHKATGIELGVVSLHLIAGAGTANDKARELQVDNLVPKVEAAADGRPVLFVGDLNSTLEQAYDGPGRAFKRHGYVDTEASTCPAKNPTYNSYNGLVNPPTRKSKQLDRLFYKPGLVTPTLRAVVLDLTSAKNHRTPWPSDHQPVAFELTVNRK